MRRWRRMRPHRYAKNEAELIELARQMKRWACPHCGRQETINAHGALRGNAESGPGKGALRGRRFFCSNRGNRPGCGQTFSIWLATMIAGASVRSRGLWRFYQAKLAAESVFAAWAGLRGGFSLEAAYRWWRRWPRAEIELRSWLCDQRGPPAEGQVLGQLAAVFGTDDPIAGFQAETQRGWPG